MLMAQENKLASRFTDEQYATKSEVANTLGTSLVDKLWDNITRYREQYAQQTPLLDLTKRFYKIVYTPSINSRYQKLQSRIVNILYKYSRFSEEDLKMYQIKDDAMKEILKMMASFKGIIINDIAISNIINRDNRNKEYAPLEYYYEALCSFQNNPLIAIDDDFFGNYLMVLSHQFELTTYYRSRDLESAKTKFVINRQYDNGAPVNEIEKHMNILLDFVNNSGAPLVVKAICAFYYLNYIKPFDSYNEELSILLFKHILARGEYESIAHLLPCEILLSKNPSRLKEVMNEVQRNRDLTYLIIYATDVLEEAFGNFTDKLIAVEGAVLKDSMFRNMSDEEFKKEFHIDKSETQYGRLPHIKEETPVEESAPKKVDVQIESSTSNDVVTPPSGEKALQLPNKRYTEEEYENLAADLLESDPFLRPQQAHFFVRHMTIGKYYTIAQYKRAEGCVYETARTSMDALAKRGYYRRENLKNKFVYTPLKRY